MDIAVLDERGIIREVRTVSEVDYKTDLATINKDVGVYNGTVIKSNGNPYCIKVNRLKNVVANDNIRM